MAKVTVKRETKQAKKEKTAAKKTEVKAENKEKIEPVVNQKAIKEEAASKAKVSSSIQVVYQFGGREITEKTLITAVKEIWMEKGNKIKDIQSLNIYMKPEEMMAYYVINDTETGKIEL